MRKVAIAGFGTTEFRARWIEKTYFELAYDAAGKALESAGLARDDVQSVVYGIYNELFERQFMPDVYIQDYIGMTLKPSMRVSAGGATGGAAVRAGFSEVASGLHDIVMVLGVEKALDCYSYKTGMPTPEVLRGIIYSSDMTYENPAGITPAASYALPVVSHMDRFDSPTEEQMAKVSVKNHKNAINNPIAQSPKLITVEDVLNSRMICYPFKFYDNCLYSEGASCLILASEEAAREITDDPVWITGIGGAVDSAFPGKRPDITEFASSRVAGEAAYRMAGIREPRKEFDFVEMHDAFTGAEILSYEAFRLCEPGEGGALVDEGAVEMDGDIPSCPSGGLIGCGHAVGATGVMQVGEAFLQVSGKAGPRQVKDAGRGLVQSIGGPATAWTFAIIIERGRQ